MSYKFKKDEVAYKVEYYNNILSIELKKIIRGYHTNLGYVYDTKAAGFDKWKRELELCFEYDLYTIDELSKKVLDTYSKIKDINVLVES